MPTSEELKMYSDYKSPYAWLGFDPAFALEERFAVKVKWKPFQLRLKGKGVASRGNEAAGDLYVKLVITLPDKPDAELEAFAATWRKERPYTPRRRS